MRVHRRTAPTPSARRRCRTLLTATNTPLTKDTRLDQGFPPHAFERFHQADDATTQRHTGLGLGLGIVRQLVKLHGGTVHAASPGVGRGATFTVCLPMAADSMKPHTEAVFLQAV